MSTGINICDGSGVTSPGVRAWLCMWQLYGIEQATRHPEPRSPCLQNGGDESCPLE